METHFITDIVQEYRDILLLAIGVFLVMGSILDWNWLCDPTGKPHAHRYTRGGRRAGFFLLGILLMVVSVWSFMAAYK